MLPHHSPRHSMLHGAMSDDGSSTSTLSMNTLASPRSNPSMLCKYKSGKCSNRRATKRNGQLHTLCHFHRVRQNEHQRKSDRKHRMVNVAKRAKLGSLGALLVTERRLGRRGSTSSLSSELTSEGESAPASPMDVVSHQSGTKCPMNLTINAFPTTTPHELGGRGDQDTSNRSPYPPPVHWRNNLARMAMQGDPPPLRVDHPMTPNAGGLSSPSIATPTGRLPPISYLTQQLPGKMDAFRSPNAAVLAFPPGGFLQGQSNSTSSQASKTA